MSVKTQTLTEFLLARIAEDEAWLAPLTAKRMIGRKVVDVPIERVPSYVQRDRDRWAAECKAKRQIVQRAEEAREASAHIGETFEGRTDARAQAERAGYGQAANALASLLFDLAAVYDNHPDYQPGWRP